MAQGQSCGAVGEDASGNAYIVRLLLLGLICLHCVFLLLCMGKQQGILALLPTQETQMEFQGFCGPLGSRPVDAFLALCHSAFQVGKTNTTDLEKIKLRYHRTLAAEYESSLLLFC